ncbi:PadR family transcriptional regulator [Propionibacteriaceae bacterium G1746]|uniref:PadR family transcriptional regulator n=1 Tax=Aestuariimicrobium sp. G57 TaxID=3418485 RepID=UPI003C18486B
MHSRGSGVTELSQAGLLAREGTIYPLLSRLRKDGLVQTAWGESPSGPPRRYYSLTPEGHQALDDFRQAWGALKLSVDDILTRRQ